MMRLRAGLPAAVALAALTIFTVAPAGAKLKAKRHHGGAPGYVAAPRRVESFPVYVDRGADRNPGGDNLYFTDTKDPHYVVGPAWFQRWSDR